MTVKLTFSNLIFDFDGTLAKLNIDFNSMKKAVLKHSEAYHVSTSDLEHLHILEMIDAGRALIDSYNNGEGEQYYREAHALITRIEIDAAEKGALLEGTREMLSELKGMKIQAGIVTRNCRAAVHKVFPDMMDYCKVFVPRDSIRHVKPHPDHLLAIMKILQASPAYTAIIGDHPLDIQAGKNIGLYTIGVLTGSSSKERLEQAKADTILSSVLDLICFIKNQ